MALLNSNINWSTSIHSATDRYVHPAIPSASRPFKPMIWDLAEFPLVPKIHSALGMLRNEFCVPLTAAPISPSKS